MRLEKLNIAEFATALRSCVGKVFLITAEGDCISANSLLYGVIGLANLFKVAENQDVIVECENPEDRKRLESFSAAQPAT